MFEHCDKEEDVGGLYLDENYFAVKHKSGVYFSFARRGNAVMAHFSSKKAGLRAVKPAINDFCEWAFDAMPWATMVMATIERPSVARLVHKCGFEHVIDADSKTVYMRVR